MRKNAPFCFLLFLFVFIRFLWLGDTAFINDEPLLLSNAQGLNHVKEWAMHGLKGTQGVIYGPFPTWFYQVTLGFSQNLFFTLYSKVILTTVFTLFSLFLLKELQSSIQLWVWLVPLASPYLWFYARDLWDNSFLTGLTPLSFACYFRFDRGRNSLFLFAALVLCTLALLTHLMALPLCGAILLHLLIYHRDWIIKNYIKISLMAMACLGIALPYLRFLFENGSQGGFHLGGLLRYLGSPFLGAGYFSWLGFEYFLSHGWYESFPALGCFILGASFFSFPIFFYGLYSVRRLESRYRTLILLNLGFHLSLYFFKPLEQHPHYFNAVWFPFFLILAHGLSLVLVKERWKWIGRAYLLSVGIGIPFAMIVLHSQAGARSRHYGASLEEQLEIAAQLSAYRESIPFVSEVEQFNQYPWALNFLRKLASDKNHGQKEAKKLILQYRNPENLRDCHLKLDVETSLF